MSNRTKPFDKESGKRIPFEELVKLIGQHCDYRFAIIDYEVDDELKAIAKGVGIDLTGYKHVIETTGVQHSQNRHGINSEDRTPLSIEDYMLIPYIIRNRDEVTFSPSKTVSRGKNVVLYKKKIGFQYVYVEEIRDGKHKSLAFKSFRKRETESPSDERG